MNIISIKFFQKLVSWDARTVQPGGEKMNTNNLYEMWKDFYDKSSNVFDEKVKEDFPSKGVGQMLEMNLMFKKMMNETTEKYFEQVNMPSRNDLASISGLIVNVDAKIDELEDLVEETKANQVTQADLQRELSDIKSEMKSLEQKLNSILTLLMAEKEQNSTQKAGKVTQSK